MHFKKKIGITKTIDYGFGQTSPLPLPFTHHIGALLMKPNLKIFINYVKFSAIQDTKDA